MSVNRVILIGHLGKDPDLRYTTSGTAVCSFSLATNEWHKNKQGDTQEKTEWHYIVAWNGTAELCAKYLHKGKQIYLEGKLHTSSYEDRNGIRKYRTEIVMDKLHMPGKSKEKYAESNNNDWSSNKPEKFGSDSHLDDERAFDDAPF